MATVPPVVVRSKCWIDYRYALVLTRGGELLHHGRSSRMPIETRRALVRRLRAEVMRLQAEIDAEIAEQEAENAVLEIPDTQDVAVW